MATSTIKIEEKGMTIINGVQGTFQLKRQSKISICKAVNMCLEHLVKLGIKPEEIIK